MNIQEATNDFEAWMKRGLPVPPGADREAIEFKHTAMKGDNAFPFLRATFYRWAQRWIEESGALGEAPRVLAVGDLHLENFGTWRDTDGHLIWGINDFDEAWELPWTSDLVRLGVSASLAIEQEGFSFEAEEVCRLILAGYAEGMSVPTGAPFDLDAGHERLRAMVESALKPTEEFWGDFGSVETKWKRNRKLPAEGERTLEDALPPGATVIDYRVQEGPYLGDIKPSGLGSLGRARCCALAVDADQRAIVREAKVVLPSAVTWARSIQTSETKIGALLEKAKRRPDPWFQLRDGWTARRIAPDAVKIGLKKLKKKHGFTPDDERTLFHAMGRETANIHLGSEQSAEILADLQKRSANDERWFAAAVESWRSKVEGDWKEFRNDLP